MHRVTRRCGSRSLAGAGAAVMFAIANRRWSALDAATAIERAGSLDNLVVTAAELDADPRPIAAEIRQEIDRQAAERLGSVDIARVVPLTQPAAIAVAILAGCALLAGIGGDVIATRAATATVERARRDRPDEFQGCGIAARLHEASCASSRSIPSR